MTPILQFFFTVGNNLIAAIRAFSTNMYIHGAYALNPVDIYHMLILAVFFIIPILRMIVSFNRNKRYYAMKKGKKIL